MNKTPDTSDISASDDGAFDPQQAAALLRRTRQQARRKFESNPPLLSLLRAIVVLVGYGAVWLSVRHQRPYQGPTGAAVAILYLLVAIVIVASVVLMRRANAGVQGKSRARPSEIISLGAAWIIVYVFMGALEAAGASHAIVYGIYPATAPLILVGLVGAALAQGRSDWPSFASTLTVAVFGAGAAFAGPAGAWLVAGCGLAAALLVHAFAKARLMRAA